MSYSVIDGGVTAPEGFKVSCAAAGIKYKDRTDMAMIYSEVNCNIAGVFTKNEVKAAPVLFDALLLSAANDRARAIVVNSGIANACTGPDGIKLCEMTADVTARELNINASQVYLGSTGVIGMQIPIDKIEAGVKALAQSLDRGTRADEGAVRAIMTTDTKPKMIAVETEISGKKVTIGAMSKGSGMIHPNMGTMLAYITTDAAITADMLKLALVKSVEDSYNMISVDGDTSTNDTCLVMANGLAENKIINSEGEDFDAFCEALNYVNQTLAKKMAADGEGATHLFEVKVNGAESVSDAKILAKSVVSSSLCKAAIYGRDANCGRFMCALGYSGVKFNDNIVDIYFESKAGSVNVISQGSAPAFDEELALKVLSEEEVTVRCEMNSGDASATAWGCDLTYDYVKINADYRS